MLTLAWNVENCDPAARDPRGRQRCPEHSKMPPPLGSLTALPSSTHHVLTLAIARAPRPRDASILYTALFQNASVQL